MTSQCDTKFCQPTYTTTGNSSGQWGSFSIAQTAARSQQCHLSGGACAPNPVGHARVGRGDLHALHLSDSP
jgi:hypothetical protein